jgi:hypothetical protein
MSDFIPAQYKQLLDLLVCNWNTYVVANGAGMQGLHHLLLYWLG